MVQNGASRRAPRDCYEASESSNPDDCSGMFLGNDMVEVAHYVFNRSGCPGLAERSRRSRRGRCAAAMRWRSQAGGQKNRCGGKVDDSVVNRGLPYGRVGAEEDHH